MSTMQRTATLGTVGSMLLALAAAAPGTAQAQQEAGAKGSAAADGAEGQPYYRDATASKLPEGALDGLSMDAAIGDLDGDGHPDVVVANEHRPNILLLNDGDGSFRVASERLPRVGRDSEDIAIADFDGDGDHDVVVVSEDDRINEYYLNRGDGTFEDAGDRIPVTGTSNAVVVGDLTGDGAPDLVIGNNGQNVFLVNDGSGGFRDATGERLPVLLDVTQDLELGDVDGDGDRDLVVGNEDRNRLLINDGSGRFTDESGDRLVYREGKEETREADFGDVDGDGDLDILFANVRAFVRDADPANRLLINDGSGQFSDASGERLPRDQDRSFDGDLIDLDRDGDLDVVTSNSTVDLEAGRIDPAPYRVYRNDGNGRFELATEAIFPPDVVGVGFDVEPADFDGDGLLDLYLASRGTPDRLLTGREPDRSGSR